MADLKDLYMREHSNIIRKFRHPSRKQSAYMMQEDMKREFPEDNEHAMQRKVVAVMLCRIRQRLLQTAWNYLTEKTRVSHDYTDDLKCILTRKIRNDELRTEYEVEVIFKWVAQVKDIDPTSVANTIFKTKKRSMVYNAIQQLRMEVFLPGDTVLFQGDLPRAVDGHFTIINGSCEILGFQQNSIPLIKLTHLVKQHNWEEAKKILNSARKLAKIEKFGGFGELATLTGVKRGASIRANRKSEIPTDILVLPKDSLVDCLAARGADEIGASDASSEAIDFMRQS
jgi:hypothetical protein